MTTNIFVYSGLVSFHLSYCIHSSEPPPTDCDDVFLCPSIIIISAVLFTHSLLKIPQWPILMMYLLYSYNKMHFSTFSVSNLVINLRLITLMHCAFCNKFRFWMLFVLRFYFFETDNHTLYRQLNSNSCYLRFICNSLVFSHLWKR